MRFSSGDVPSTAGTILSPPLSSQAAGLFVGTNHFGGNERSSKELCLRRNNLREVFMGRGILLWLLGIPIPIIILIMLFAR